MKTTIISRLTFLGLIHLTPRSCTPILPEIIGGTEIVRAGAEGFDAGRAAAASSHASASVTEIGTVTGNPKKITGILKPSKQPPRDFTPKKFEPLPTIPEVNLPDPKPLHPPTTEGIHDAFIDDKFLTGVGEPIHESPKGSTSPELEEHLLNHGKPKPFYPVGTHSKEYWQLFTTRTMLKFISERGTPEMKQWITENKFAQEGLAWFKQETWLSHFLTKRLKVDPKWRIQYDSTAFGKEGLTGQISKGWVRAWGDKVKQRQALEKAMTLPFIPLLKALGQISKAVDKLTAKTIDYYLEWLKAYGSAEIRNEIPHFQKMAGSSVVHPL